MAEIRKYPFCRHLRSDANVHITRFRNGKIVRAGRGLAFWFLPQRTSLAELPMDDRSMTLFFKGRSKDFQTITVQGNLTWHVVNPATLGDRVDFSIDLVNGKHTAKPMEQIEGLLTGTAQEIATQYLAEGNVHDLLDAGIEPLRARLEKGLSGAERLTAMGLEVAAIRLTSIAPTAELERALQTPTFENMQQKADQATFERRALAVEKERAIAENELNNKTELAKRETQLIAQEAANAHARATGTRDAQQIEADGEAGRIRTVEQAKSEMEREGMAIVRDLPPSVLLGLAAREFAGNPNKIEHLNVTPDLLAALLAQFKDGAKPG